MYQKNQKQRPTLIDRVKKTIRTYQYSRRTEEAYVQWIKRFIIFHDMQHPNRLGKSDMERFLSHLAVHQKVSASTQNQALAALMFLYRKVLGVDATWVNGVIRAKKPKHLPTVLSRNEVKVILDRLEGKNLLMASLLYGCGLRLLECLRLRIKDVDFDQNMIIVFSGKGAKDRTTMLPNKLKAPLQRQIESTKQRFNKIQNRGPVKTSLPPALERKYPNIGLEWTWQFVFPASQLSPDEETGELR